MVNLEEMEDVEKVIVFGEKKLKIVFWGWGIVVESFVFIFVVEWGDCIQIVIIVLVVFNNVWGVLVGVIFGYIICVVIVVMGGKFVVGCIFEKIVMLIGGFLFYLFVVVFWWIKIVQDLDLQINYQLLMGLNFFIDWNDMEC